ncbi:MAG: TetR/AcrR family transcriptional regulator [Methyloprofundus sp.]|nr:TetR/AcrR family transcriptional regulator [Methyloprofundus sp.]
MARRSEHSQQQIKQMVLEAAEEIIQEQGFSALKVRKIAMDIGYTVGSVYMVFANMNDLNMHIKARTWQKLLLHLEQSSGESIALVSIENMAVAYLDFTVLNKGLWCMLFEHQPPIDEQVPEWYLQALERVVEFVDQLMKQLNTSHSDAQIQQAAQALTASVQGVCMQLLMRQPSIENIKLARADVVLLVECFMRGWLEEAK